MDVLGDLGSEPEGQDVQHSLVVHRLGPAERGSCGYVIDTRVYWVLIQGSHAMA